MSGTDHEDFQTQVLRAVGKDPTKLEQAKAAIGTLAATAASGRDPNLPGPRVDLAGERAQLSQTLRSLQAPDSRSRAVAPDTIGALESSSQFPQRGKAINNRRSWTFNTEIDGAFCAIVCITTDRIRAKWTIDPGRSADRIGFNSNYFPNMGNFNNIFATAYAFCNDGQCGSLEFPPPDNARNGTGSGTVFVQHSSIPGGRLKDGIAVQAFFLPTGQNTFDRAGTGTATCLTGEDTSCPY